MSLDALITCFQALNWHSATIDIREQYPLPIEDTLLICQNLGIRHPQYQGKLKVVTTDLLIDFSDREQLAVAVKPVLALDDERTVEKLQVEKSFWQSLGVEWKLFTEREVPKIVRENLLWLRPVMDENNNDTSHDEMEVRELLHRVSELGQRSVTKACATLDDQYGVEAGSHLQVLRYGVAKRMIQAPIQTSFHGWKCSEISLAVAPSLMGAKHAN